MVIKNEKLKIGITVLLFFSLITTGTAHPIDDYYKKYKNDQDMEAKIVPPKVASLMVDKDYPEAIEVLQSLSKLKYLNFWGDASKIKKYAAQAISAKGNYKLLLEESDNYRTVSVFGTKKKGTVRKLIAVVKTKAQFLLLIGKGKLTMKQVKYLPALSKEIQ